MSYFIVWDGEEYDPQIIGVVASRSQGQDVMQRLERSQHDGVRHYSAYWLQEVPSVSVALADTKLPWFCRSCVVGEGGEIPGSPWSWELEPGTYLEIRTDDQDPECTLPGYPRKAKTQVTIEACYSHPLYGIRVMVQGNDLAAVEKEYSLQLGQILVDPVQHVIRYWRQALIDDEHTFAQWAWEKQSPRIKEALQDLIPEDKR